MKRAKGFYWVEVKKDRQPSYVGAENRLNFSKMQNPSMAVDLFAGRFLPRPFISVDMQSKRKEHFAVSRNVATVILIAGGNIRT